MSLSEIFRTTADVYPDNLALLYFEDKHSSRKITYRELQVESNKVFKTCENVRHQCASQDCGAKSQDVPGQSAVSDDTSATCSEIRGTTQSTTENILYNNVNNKMFLSTYVGFMCQPGPSAIACMLGILQNYTFFHISPDWTKIEIESYIHRVCPKILLVEECFTAKLSRISLETLGTLHIFDSSFVCFYYHNEEMPFKPDCELKELAYIIPTSGTTGIPKVVYVPHKCIVPNILDIASIFQAKADDSIFCASALTFDPSIIDLFVAFLVGASLVMVNRSLLKIPNVLLHILSQNKITILQATPSLMFSLGKERLKNNLLNDDSSLKVLALGGEIIPKLSVLKEWISAKCKTRIFNLYGITEVSCWASLAEVSFHPEIVLSEMRPLELNSKASDSKKKKRLEKECIGFNKYPFQELTSIGDPLSATVIKVFKNLNQEVKEGEEGEIYIGGCERICWIDDGNISSNKGLKCLDDPKQVRDCVFKKGYSAVIKPKGQLIMRRTGDKGVVHMGKIYCVGRIDRQVKRHGQKVSLSEIERQCESLTYIESCHAVLHSDIKINAFIQVNKTLFKSVTGMWKDLKNLLTPWKLPDDIIIIDRLPFNSHGKVDENLLLELKQESLRTNAVNYEFASDRQEFLAKLWKRILGIKHVGEDDNFIQAGGSSLSALQFIEEIENYLGFKVPVLLDTLLNETFKNIYVTINKCKDQECRTVWNSHKKIKVEENVAGFTKSNDPDSSILKSKTFHPDYKDKDDAKHYLPKPISVSRRGVSYFENKLLHYNTHSDISLLWKYNMGKCIDASPAVIEYPGGKTFLMVGSHSHKFACIDVQTGSEQWCLKLGDRIESSPCISMDGRYVFVGCYDYNLYCISIREGEIVWKYTTGAEIKSSPVIDDETGCVVFGCHDKYVYCLTADGNVKWRLKLSQGSLFSSPCIVGDQVFSATLDGVIAGIDKRNGNINWKLFLKKPIFSSLTPYSKGIIFGNVVGELFGYSTLGARLWEFKTNGAVFSSAFVQTLQNGEEVIAIGCHDHCVYFFNSSGSNIATYHGESPIYATPFIFCLDVQHIARVVICETSGKYYFVDLKFKETCCQMALENNAVYSNSLLTVLECNANGKLFSSPVVHQNRLYICSRDDFVYCFKLITKI